MQKIKTYFTRVAMAEVILSMSGNGFEIPLVQGDTGPKIRLTLVDDSGTPVAVSGAGQVKLYMAQPGLSHSNAGHEACVAYDAPNGLWDYNLEPGDVSAAGTYFGDIEIEFDDGTIETAPDAVRFMVRENNKR